MNAVVAHVHYIQGKRCLKYQANSIIFTLQIQLTLSAIIQANVSQLAWHLRTIVKNHGAHADQDKGCVNQIT